MVIMNVRLLSRVSASRKEFTKLSLASNIKAARDLKRIQQKGHELSYKNWQRKSKSKSAKVRVRKEEKPLQYAEMLGQETKQIYGGDEATIDVTRQNPAFDYEYEKGGSSFSEMGLCDELVTALDSRRISLPTSVQLLTIPRILNGENILCAAQTGTGKTVTYLAPIMQTLKQEESDGFIRRPGKPRACIILPVRELAVQTLRVIKSLSQFMPSKSEAIIPGRKRKWIKENVADTVDIIVGTPREILFYKEKGRISFSDLQFLVLDEFDTLWDRSFKLMTNKIIDLAMLKPTAGDFTTPPQCILTMATFPKEDILNDLHGKIPALKTVTASLHRVLPHVKHKFVKTIQRNKAELLLRYLAEHHQRQRQKVMVFTNSVKTCNWLAHYLQERNINHVALHGDVKKVERSGVLKSFIEDECRLLICTDVASRGIDTSDVSVVVNYDCPMTSVDYLHRAGRTGRVGATYTKVPEVFTLVTGYREASLAAKIKLAASKNESLRDIRLRQ